MDSLISKIRTSAPLRNINDNLRLSLNLNFEHDFGLSIDLCKFDQFDSGVMKKIEQAHWNYVDHLISERGLPYMNLSQFTAELMCATGIDREIAIDQARKYCKTYDKHKKSLSTAGTVLIFENSLLLVRVVGSPVWSMPKGKSDGDETLQQTAIRETKEETGVNLCEVINLTTPTISVQKTTFFLVESDSRMRNFTGYNAHEIVQIGWHEFKDIQEQPNQYSKQVRAVHTKLVELGYLGAPAPLRRSSLRHNVV